MCRGKRDREIDIVCYLPLSQHGTVLKKKKKKLLATDKEGFDPALSDCGTEGTVSGTEGTVGELFKPWETEER